MPGPSAPADTATHDPAATEPHIADPAQTQDHHFTPDAADQPAVPGYAVLRRLGVGGMGAVYLARQQGLNRLVALKLVLDPDGVGSAARFLAEAEAMAAVKHPHVAAVYDFGTANGRPYLALELCEGGSLADRLKSRKAGGGGGARHSRRVTPLHSSPGWRRRSTPRT